MTLKSLDQGTATLEPLPGQRDVLKFAASPLRRDQLAGLLRQVLGRPVRVEITAPSSSAAGDAPAAKGPPSANAERQAATLLPLVQQVMDVFDVTIVGVRPEGQTPAPQPAAEPAAPSPAPAAYPPPAAVPAEDHPDLEAEEDSDV